MKLFVMLSRVPYPLDKGDKLRAYHQLRQLSVNHEIYLCCLSDKKVHPKAIQELSEFCKSVEIVQLSKIGILWRLFLALFSQKPFQRWYFYSKKAQRIVNKIIEEVKPDHIYCQLIRAADYVKNYHSIPKTLDYMDAFSKGVERRIESAGVLKPVFKVEYKRLVRFEHLLFEYFEGKTIISEADRDWIMHPKRKEIKVVPNGIDTSYFTPTDQQPTYDMVFVGNMSYPPNVEAAKVLVNEILPEVEKKKNGVKLLLAGATPSKQVLALAKSNVTITGWVEDIRTAYADGKVFVAPLKIGTGLQNKLLEAMAMEKACVTTTLVNGALKANPENEARICDSNQEFVNAILELLEQKEMRNDLGVNARKFVVSNYSWSFSVKLLEEIIEKVSS